jgi:hypothetical protein
MQDATLRRCPLARTELRAPVPQYSTVLYCACAIVSTLCGPHHAGAASPLRI